MTTRVEVIYQGEVITPGDCDGEYTIERSWLAIDNCLNETLETQTITVIDTTAPEFTFIPDGGDYSCDADLPEVNAEAEDNCSDATVSYADVTTPGDCPQSYSIVRTFTAIDDCGHEASESIEFFVYDLEAPVFTFVPADATVECDAPIPTDDATATDNCGEVTITSEDVVSTGGATSFDGCSADFRSELGFYSFGTPRVFEALDVTIGAGNELDMGDEIENLEGFTGGLSVNIDGSTLTVGTAETFDEGFADFEYVTVEITNMSCAGVSNVEVDSDLLLDPDSSPYTLTVDFTTNSITLTWEINEGEEVILITEGGESIFDLSGSISCIPENVITRTWTAVDQCGNEATASQVITIVDTTAPVFDEYEVNIEMPCDDIDDNILVTATDNCGAVTITFEDDNVSGGCAGVVIRAYTATDECGNESYAEQIINLTDTTDPALAGVPDDLTIECGDDIPQPADVTADDNCDDELEVVFEETIEELDCLYAIHRMWTVTDHCGNSDSATQIITLIDTTAPEFEGTDYSIDAECDETVEIGEPSALDICDENVDVTVNVVSTPGSCANDWTEVHTYTATDDCENSSELVVTVNYSDNTPPVFDFVPASYIAECDDVLEMLEPTATDNCGEVTIIEIPVQELLGCDNSYLLTRAFIATDACGNQSAAAQVITVLDSTPPTFDQEVEDTTVECYGDAIVPELTASDNCGGAEVTSDSIEDVDECGNGTITVSYLAIDECGNTSETSLTITILDTTDPVLEGDFPQDMVVDCEDDAPDAPELTATDNCDQNIEVSYSEELVGDLPAEGSIADCALSTGDSPYYNPDWSLWLQEFPNGDEFYTSDEAYFVEYPDGTAHLSGHLTSTQNANAGWEIDVWFMNGMDWDSWSNQAFPTSYKDDFNLAGDNYLDWTYYIVNSGSATMTGTGDYAGSLLTLAHAPSNMFYGYQVGIAANNVNTNYGNGGWFYFDGVLVENSIETEVDGAGDFAFDADCCPRYEIVRTWTATDCAGNSTSWTQTISFSDIEVEGAPEGGELPALDLDEKWEDEIVGLDHRVYPNPIMGNATFSFTPVKDGKTTLEIFNLSGSNSQTIFNQEVEGGVTYKVPFSSGEMAGGVYLYQIVNGDTVVTGKMIITK